MMSEELKKKVDTFIYAIMKEARRSSLMETLAEYDIDESDYVEIQEYFKSIDIKL